MDEATTELEDMSNCGCGCVCCGPALEEKPTVSEVQQLEQAKEEVERPLVESRTD